MDSIELKRVEIRWLIIGLMTVPFAIFLVGFYLGLNQAKLTSEFQPTIAKATEEKKQVIEEALTLPVPPVAQAIIEEPPKAVEPPMPQEQPISMEVVVLQEKDIEEKIEKMPKDISLEDLSQNLFAVQAGNFSTPENAEKFSHSLKNKGINAKVIGNATRTGKNSYRVVIGIFNDKSNAELAAAEQHQQHNIDTYVAKLY